MTDDVAIKAEQFPYQFTKEQVLPFLAAKWKLKKCEICEQEGTFGVNIYSDGTKAIILAGLTSDGVPKPIIQQSTMSFLTLTCSNCGNTKMILARKVRDWLDDQK